MTAYEKKNIPILLYLTCIFYFLSMAITGYIRSSESTYSIALKLIAINLFFTFSSYFLFNLFFTSRICKILSVSLVRPRISKIIFFALLSFNIIGVMTAIIFMPASPSIEVIKRFLDDSFKSKMTNMELRLASSFMPIWAQIVFESARRFAAPYCLGVFYFSMIESNFRKPIAIILFIILSFFILFTADRSISVLYFGIAIVIFFLKYKKEALHKKYLYLCIIGLFSSLVFLKHIQYGEFWSASAMDKIRWDRVSLNNQSEMIATHLDAPVSEMIATHLDAPVSEMIATHLDAPVLARTSSLPIYDYLYFSTSSIIQRIFTSPIDMFIYSIKSYDETNYQHWRSNRMLSFLPAFTKIESRYVSPLEVGELRYNDAFPVSFLGDLWRNGGYIYIAPYSIFLGLLLSLLSQTVFSKPELYSLQAISMFGIALLFYSNALNSSSLLMIVGSLITFGFIKLNSKIHKKDFNEKLRNV